MSTESFNKFMTAVLKDESMKNELQNAGGQASDPVYAVIAFAKTKGYEITAADVNGELAEQELDRVSGGAYATSTTQLGSTSAYNTQAASTTTTYSTLINQLFSSKSYYSDRRLKSSIRRVGTHALGIGIYEYEIFGRRECGVMADEVERVKPEAVITNCFGIKMVNYGAL